MSVLVSRPINSAFRRAPSLNTTLISSASAMTWLLVTTSPDAIDHKAGAERGGAALRRAFAVFTLPALTAAAVLEKLLEKILERRARRQLRSGTRTLAGTLARSLSRSLPWRLFGARIGAGFDPLRGRDIHHRIDHTSRRHPRYFRGRAPCANRKARGPSPPRPRSGECRRAQRRLKSCERSHHGCEISIKLAVDTAPVRS